METIDALPDKCRTALPEDVEVLQCIRTDVDGEGRFVDQWAILTPREIFVMDGQGAMVRRVVMTVVLSADALMYVGGGRLSVKTTDGPVVVAHYSPSAAARVSVLVSAINALAKGEPIPGVAEKDLPRNCSTCGRPLDPGSNVCPLCLDKGRVILRLIGYTKRFRGLLLVSTSMLIVATVVSLVPPYLTKVILDKVLTPRHPGNLLLILVLGLLLATVLQMILQAIRGYLGVWLGSRIMGQIRKDVYDALMRLSLSYFDKRQTSQFIGRVNQDAEAMQQFLTDGVIMITSQAMSLLGIIILMLRLNWFLAILAFITTPLILVASLLVWPIVRQRWYRQWRARVKLNVLVGDSLNGIRVVKAFGQEGMERSRYQNVNQQLVHLTTGLDGLWQAIFPLFNFISGFGVVLVWYFGGRAVLNGSLTIGTLMAFIGKSVV